MVNSFADWLCNVLVWASIVTLAVLLYDVFVSGGFLNNVVNPVNGLIAIAVVAMLSALWPKY
jgi:hypothetical protein